jgi:hypothetical protein
MTNRNILGLSHLHVPDLGRERDRAAHERPTAARHEPLLRIAQLGLRQKQAAGAMDHSTRRHEGAICDRARQIDGEGRREDEHVSAREATATKAASSSALK